MKTRKYKIPTWFINEELCHKVEISYDNESKRAYQLLDILWDKFRKIDNRKNFNWIEVTEEEYQVWYVYFLEYYIDDESIYAGSNEYKEAKKLLTRMVRFFGTPTYDMNHRAGAFWSFARELAKTGLPNKLLENLKTKH